MSIGGPDPSLAPALPRSLFLSRMDWGDHGPRAPLATPMLRTASVSGF